MAAFDILNYAALADKFQKFYDIFNATMIALKGGNSNDILISTGGGAPVFSSAWEDFIIVGSGGGAAGFDSYFSDATISTIEILRYRKSAILNSYEISGRFASTNSLITNGGARAIFVLPVGFRPQRNIAGLIRNNSNGALYSCYINFSTGDVVLINNSGSDIATGQLMDLNIQFSVR